MLITAGKQLQQGLGRGAADAKRGAGEAAEDLKSVNPFKKTSYSSSPSSFLNAPVVSDLAAAVAGGEGADPGAGGNPLRLSNPSPQMTPGKSGSGGGLSGSPSPLEGALDKAAATVNANPFPSTIPGDQGINIPETIKGTGEAARGAVASAVEDTKRGAGALGDDIRRRADDVADAVRRNDSRGACSDSPAAGQQC
jgi:hypothetical protein